jgi:hypothetical protein
MSHFKCVPLLLTGTYIAGGRCSINVKQPNNHTMTGVVTREVLDQWDGQPEEELERAKS